MELDEEAVLPGDAVALDDLRGVAGDLGNLLQLPARGADPDDGCDGVADCFRVDYGLVAGDHTGPLEPLYALRDGR